MDNPEAKRLKLVRLVNKLDLNNCKELKDIATLVKELYALPMVMINLIGKDKVMIKVKTGIAINSNSRDQSFCKYLIDSDQVLVVPDASKDERFKNYPAVTGKLNICFYAGAPLITAKGYHIGSLCVAGHSARNFSDKDREMLTMLSRQVLISIEMRMNLLYLKEQKEKVDLSARKLRAIFNSSSSCHILVGKDLKILDYNKVTSSFVKDVEKKQIKKGANVLNFISPGFKFEFLTLFKKALSGKRSNKDVLINHSGKVSIWWNITFFPVRDEHGNIISVCFKSSNVNENKMQGDVISSKNELLSNIAYIQSHEYRKPVASILGLMNIIKDENYKPKEEYLMMMESAVNELDEKIKSVVGFTEKSSCETVPTENLSSVEI